VRAFLRLEIDMPHEDMPGESWLTKEIFIALAFASMVALNGLLMYDNMEADEQVKQLQRDVGYLKIEVQGNDKDIATLFNIFIQDPIHEPTGSF
jgi:hypothetical protein